MTGWEQEHLRDPEDKADAFFLLDDGEARLGVSECCGKFICTCDPDAEALRGFYRGLRRVPSTRDRA